jgi:hypothetical protein
LKKLAFEEEVVEEEVIQIVCQLSMKPQEVALA